MICPICGFEGEPGPVSRQSGARETMECPECGGTSRHRAVMQAVFQATPDLAIHWRRSDGHMCRGDLSFYQVGEDMLTKHLRDQTGLFVVSELTERAGVVMQDLEALTFADASFDVAICSDVLEHVRLYDKALSELARVLKPGGALILTVPLAWGPYHEQFCGIWDREDPTTDEWVVDPPVHADPLDPAGCRVYRYYAIPQLTKKLNAVGFDVELTPADIPEHGVKNCAVFLCRKTAVSRGDAEAAENSNRKGD